MKKEIKEAIRSAFEIFVAEEVARIKESISIPVGREGRRIIRSLPGENPRKEKSDLQRSIQKNVTENGHLVVAEIFTDDPKAEWLNNGTKDNRIAPRPFWDRAWQRVLDSAEKIESDITKEITDNNTPTYSKI